MDATTIRLPVKKKGAGPLFQIRRDDKWGFMDRAGKVAIPPQFDDERDFFNGLAAVLVGGKWGYVDEKGNLAVAPRFDDVRDFAAELAPVRLGRKWGYIDRTGKLSIEPRFQSAAEFHEGLARVHLWDRVLCTSGTYTSETAPEYAFHLAEDDRTDFRECFPEGGRFGFIKKDGNFAIPPRYFIAGDFSEGAATVRIEETPDSKVGFIDQSGTFLISPRFNQAGRFSEGRAAVEVSARREGDRMVNIAWGFVDKSGSMAVPAAYQQASAFSEGLAQIMMPIGNGSGDPRFGFIDRNGRIVIPASFNAASDFSEGLAWVCTDSRCAYLNPQGTFVLQFVGSRWPFVDGLTVSGIYGPGQKYVDRKGTVVAPYDLP